MTPLDLTELLVLIAASALWLATTKNLVIQGVTLVTYGVCAFGVTGPARWNGLPNYLKEPSLTYDLFKRQLNTSFFVPIRNHLLLALP
jgi:hypothetical protein